MKYTHVVIHENGYELCYNQEHAGAILLEGMAMGWGSPTIVKFDQPMTEQEAIFALTPDQE